MQCELCSHEVDENEAEVITMTYETELQDGTKTEVTDHYWACPDCVDENALKKDQDTLDK